MRLAEYFNSSEHSFFMLDVESVGLSTHVNFMTSLALVKFDGTNGAVEDKLHFSFSNHPPLRFAQYKTLEWRKERNVDELESNLTSLVIPLALSSITDFFRVHTYSQSKKPVLIANHPEFDVSFLAGYYDEYDEPRPWEHNLVFDLGSMLLGRGIVHKYNFYKKVVDSKRWKALKSQHFNGESKQHDAFYDCVFQIEVLIQA